MADRHTTISKAMAYLLRHHPEAGGITLDEAGWTTVTDLLAGLRAIGRGTSRQLVHSVVNDSPKARFELDGERIRAAQGHSVPVELGLPASTPPTILFHGTVERFLPSIAADGLRPGSRTHVHLSADRATAHTVGARRGRPVILTVAAGAMADDGHRFNRAANGVWLVGHVPPAYLTIPAGADPVAGTGADGIGG